MLTNVKFGYGKEQSSCQLQAIQVLQMCETEFTNKIQSVAKGLLDAEFASLTALEVNKGWHDF